KQWTDYADAIEKGRKQKEADLEKLRKVLPLSSLSLEQKEQLVANYVGAFGTDELLELLPLLGAEALPGLCKKSPVIAKVTMSVRVEAKDEQGDDVKGRVLFGGQALGDTPAQVTATLCRNDRLGVSEIATGK